MYGTDESGYTVSWPAGSSRLEPGITPRQDMTLRFAPWSDMEQECADSRVWGAVHFGEAVTEGAKLGHEVAAVKYESFRQHIQGTAPAPRHGS